jgi:adenylate cyclase
MPSDIQRKLTTILAADAAGYSRVMEANEVEGLRALKAARAVFKKSIARHHGRIANTAGDGLIAEFPSVVEAVQCAIEVQRELGDQPFDADLALNFRIGIHLGDVMIDGEDLLGEGVNLAARLQTMAEPGGILISRQVYDQVRGKLSVSIDYLGEKHPRNFTEGVEVYGISIVDGDDLDNADARVVLREPGRAKAPKAAPAPRHPMPQTAPPEAAQHSAAQTEAPAPSKAAPRHSDSALDKLEDSVKQRAKQFGLIFAGLFLIDIFTGRPMRVQFPGLAMAVILALQAMPLWTEGRISRAYMRIVVMSGAAILINLFTWSGTFWAIWPVGGLIFAELMRRTSRKRRQ